MEFALAFILGFPMIFWFYIVIEKITNWSIYYHLKNIVNMVVEKLPKYIFGIILSVAILLCVTNYDSINIFCTSIMSLFIQILSTPNRQFLHVYPYACKYAFIRRVPELGEINEHFF